MKRIRICLAVAVACMAALALCPVAFAADLGAYGVKAQAKFKVADENVIQAKSVTKMKEALAEAGEEATASNPYMVYVPKGSYNVSESLRVPKNVVFAAEKASKFTLKGKSLWVTGSVYGGTYNANKSVPVAIWLELVKFTGKNGIIQNVVVTKPNYAGICPTGVSTQKTSAKKCKGAQIIGCTVKNSVKQGVSSWCGATIKCVKNCTFTNCGSSGVNLHYGNVTNIIDNKITGCKDHGISTDTDSQSSKHCKIGTISGNTISKISTHGIYVEDGCTVKLIQKNKITNCKNGGIDVNGAKASAKIGAGNKISKCKNGVYLGKGKVEFKSSKISFSGNHMNVYNAHIGGTMKGGKYVSKLAKVRV